MPEAVTRLPYVRVFSAGEFQRLQRGLVPEAMEDKWFVVWRDDALWLYRSWTGMCVYCLRFAEEGAQVRVSEALVNRDPQQGRAMEAEDMRALAYLLDSLLQWSLRAR